MNKLYGVGVGPGDPELLTRKAVRIIQSCQVVAVPRTGSGEHMALGIVEELLGEQEILYCSLPMTRDSKVLEESWRQAAEDICCLLDLGKDVAFLTIGDPCIYATYGYLHERVTARGYEAEIIPGVPSFCAAAAALGKPLCQENQPLHIIPAGYPGLENALQLDGTKVLMKSGKKHSELVRLLQEKELLDKTSLVERCSLPEQVVIPSLEGPVDVGYFALWIIEGENGWSIL